MTINVQNLEKFKSYGFALTPVTKSLDPEEDKKPHLKDFKWSTDWTDQELLDANRIGAFHKDSKIFDVDIDDKKYIANKFYDLLPPTFTIGKKVNGRVVTTHLIYKSNDPVKDYKKAQPVIELLANTQTIIAGVDRVIINDREPIFYSADQIKSELKLIAAFSELVKHWPTEKGSRNECFFKLGGALATSTDIPMHTRLKYVERLCELTGDTEIKNRLSCIERQQKKFDEGIEEQWGINELSKQLGINLKYFDLIKREDPKEEEDLSKATGLEFLNGHQFTVQDFPKPQYILYPIVAKQQIRCMYAKAGTGKTLYAMHEACALASGYGFLHFKNEKQIQTPVLYVEGEMDSSSIQKRFDDVERAYEREGKKLNKNNIFFATLALQKDMYFQSLTEKIGRLNVEITAQKIEKITGIKPVIYLDNITALTVMQEKEGADWVELMHWLSRLRNRGYHVTFLHHPTKQNDSPSGSNIQERSIDISQKLDTPDDKNSLEEYDDEGFTQMVLEFGKWREHKNTFHSKTRIAVIERGTGKWTVFPMLNKTQRKIFTLLKEGKKAADIIDPNKEGLSKAHVYKTIKILKKEGVFEDEIS